MVDEETLKFRISKKAYIFTIRKKYENVKRFVQKKPPLSKNLIERVSSFLSTPQKKVPVAQKADEKKAEEAPKTSPTIKTILLPIAAFAFFLLLAAFYFSFSQNQPPPPQKAPYTPWVDVEVKDFQILDWGETPQFHTAYFEISYNQKDLSSAKILATFFPNPLPRQVFILQTKSHQAETYQTFRSKLEELLTLNEISVNDVTYAQLKSLPPRSVLIIPTGYFPTKLFESSFFYQDLLSKGIIIIYIGLPFDRILNDEGIPIVSSKELLSSLPFIFERPTPSDEDFRLFDPQYSVAPRIASQIAKTKIYGSISALALNSSYFVFLPQTLDGGWRRNGETAAEDISRLISNYAWQNVLAKSEVQLMVENSTSDTVYIYSPPLLPSEIFSIIRFEGESPDGQKISRRVDLALSKKQNSNIYVKGGSSFLPTYLTGQKIRLILDFKESGGGQRKLFLQTIKDGQVIKSEQVQEGLTNLQSPLPFDYDSSLPSGIYILRVVDSTNRVYAQAQVEVEDFSVYVANQDFKNGNFSFSFTSSKEEKIPFQRLKVSVDGKFEKEIQPSTVLLYYVPNLPPGTHNFTFEFDGGFKKSIQIEYILQKQFYENPLIIFMGMLTILFFAIGTYLRKPEKQLLVIDIPEFPPISQIKIPIKKDQVLELFDTVNKTYQWRYMPLSLEDLKSGFRKLKHNGSPIIIGDYNLERILLQIQNRTGEVKEVLGFWCLKRWETEAKRSLKNLSLFRHVRDVLITKAIKFSRPTSNEEADVKFSISGREYAICFFEDDSSAYRALCSISEYPTILLFENSIVLEEFSKRLTSTTPLAVRIKLEVASKRLFLISLEQLPSFIDSIII
ncbi:MAG: hypothetical protein QXN01_01450 [Candidatus Anstonellales archaeon]